MYPILVFGNENFIKVLNNGLLILRHLTMHFHTLQLPNGIRVIHLEDPHIETMHCGLMVKCGSRDERKDEQGMAHLIEHALFKGTRKRKAFHILNRLDSVGGEVNAYTTKEETCVYASGLKSHFERALELITDIVFSPVFPEKELQKEKQVIVDEINSYKDNPGEEIFEEFEEKLFSGHPVGHSILGNAKAILRYSQKDLQQFVKRNYATNEMVFSCVGNVGWKQVKRMVEKHLGAVPAVKKVNGKQVPFLYKPFLQEERRNIHQVHAVCGTPAFSLSEEKRKVMILLNNILGGPALNSRLNLNIRERYGFCYHIESNYGPYSDVGAFSIYFGTDEKHYKRCYQLVLRELKSLCEKPLSAFLLNAARNQLLGQVALGQENRANLMLAMGKSYLYYDRVDTLDDIREEVYSVSAADLMETAREIFVPDKISMLSYLPAK